MSKKRNVRESLELTSPRSSSTRVTRSQSKKAAQHVSTPQVAPTVDLAAFALALPELPVIVDTSVAEKVVSEKTLPDIPYLLPIAAPAPEKQPKSSTSKGKGKGKGKGRRGKLSSPQGLTAKEIRKIVHEAGLQVAKAVVQLLQQRFPLVTDRDLALLVLRQSIDSVSKMHTARRRAKRVLLRHVEPLVILALEMRKFA